MISVPFAPPRLGHPPWRFRRIATRDEAVGAEVAVSVRPENIRLVPGAAAGAASENALTGRVRQITFMGSITRVEIEAAHGVALQVAAKAETTLAPGSEVTAALFYVDHTAAVPRG